MQYNTCKDLIIIIKNNFVPFPEDQILPRPPNKTFEIDAD